MQWLVLALIAFLYVPWIVANVLHQRDKHNQ